MTASISVVRRLPPEELYDTQADPHEINNMAQSPEHQATLRRLRHALGKWIAETHDQGATLEPAELVARKGMTKAGTNPQTGYTAETVRTNAPGKAKAFSTGSP